MYFDLERIFLQKYISLYMIVGALRFGLGLLRIRILCFSMSDEKFSSNGT